MRSHLIEFTSSGPPGRNLVAEVLTETGIDIAAGYGYAPPDTIVIAATLVGERAADIQAVIDAHVPAEPAPTAAELLRARLRELAAKGFSGMTEAERDEFVQKTGMIF